jgi:hypothetical protein
MNQGESKLSMNNVEADILREACAALEGAGPEVAREVLRRGYPFMPQVRAGRSYSKAQMMRVFLRDGFVDRYSGERLVFPGTLRVLSLACPEEFPFHRNWKTDCCHVGYYELFPTIDHVVPVTRGGLDDESNWLTTSMLRNGVKALWTLKELGWHLHPPGRLEDWDGLTGWFCRFMEADLHPEINRDVQYLRDWYRMAKSYVTCHYNS